MKKLPTREDFRHEPPNCGYYRQAYLEALEEWAKEANSLLIENETNTVVEAQNKSCGNCSKKETCKIIDSCKERGYPHCRFYEGNGVNNNQKDTLISFEQASKPLIKWLCENEHPHVTAIITSNSCELLDGKYANPKIFDYVVD